MKLGNNIGKSSYAHVKFIHKLFFYMSTMNTKIGTSCKN